MIKRSETQGAKLRNHLKGFILIYIRKEGGTGQERIDYVGIAYESRILPNLIYTYSIYHVILKLIIY